MSANSHKLPVSCSRLVICEKSGNWAKMLRRRLPDRGRWIVETRARTQWAAALDEHPASLALVEGRPESVVQTAISIERIHQQRRHCHLIALLSAANPQAEAILREAGSVDVVTSRRDVDRVLQFWERHILLYPPREKSLHDQIFDRLPWPQYCTPHPTDPTQHV